MVKKYYAVKQGRQPGIYETWAECQKQTSGYSGAVFKSFLDKGEAEYFVYGDYKQVEGTNKKSSVSVALNEIPEDSCYDVIAYIDGSFDKTKGRVGFGGIIIYDGKEEEFSFGTEEPRYTEFWNVAGELLAAMHVMNWVKEKGLTSCAIYYDYMGIEMWAMGKWKANNALTQEYASFAKSMLSLLDIKFNKVAAHTGVVYNERADQLAKKGTTQVNWPAYF